MDKIDTNLKLLEFRKDLQARRMHHKMMNYHYLMYKGISLLNQQYSREILESLGLQINVPRTFMTIESIRPDLNKPINIYAKWVNRKDKSQANKVAQMLKGEWMRSKADLEKAKSEFDGLLFGSGYLLSLFENDEEESDIFDGYDNDGKPQYKKGIRKIYEGMRVKWLNPYYVIPDRKAKTYEPRQHTSPRRIWVPAIWDYDMFLEEAKKKDYDVKGLLKGGDVEEYDAVKRQIDALYTRTMTEMKTRDNGLITSASGEEPSQVIDDNSLLVVAEYTPTETNLYAGPDFKLISSTKRISPKKEIPIYVIKDYDVPGELEGIGEAEVIRWQQYEENKVHNLMYLQVILNTVKRYGIMEDLLVDPTEVRMSNPLKPIRMKFREGAKISDAVQMLDQHSSSDVPLRVLDEVKTIGQMATGQTDYGIGASESEANTLGEAKLMAQAGNKRVRQKIQTMEEGGITPILEQWLCTIPMLYTEELDYLVNDGVDQQIKFLPFDRNMNKNAKLVAEYSVREGVQAGSDGLAVTTLEQIFLAEGYMQVVFISDLIGSYNLTIKTAAGLLDRMEQIRQYRESIADARADNAEQLSLGRPAVWDTSKMTEELLRLQDEVVDDVNDFKLEQPIQPGMQPGGTPGQGGAPSKPVPPGTLSAPKIPTQQTSEPLLNNIQ